jgi:hypothetical protein
MTSLPGADHVRLRRVRLRDDERGFTLVAVVGSMAILTVFLLGSLVYTVQSTGPNRKDQDAKSAVAAAQAGIDDFISRLNLNDTYWVSNSRDTYGIAGSGWDSSNAALTVGGTPVPGTGGTAAKYHYGLLSSSSETTQSGIIRLQVTGRSRNASRSLIAQLQPAGFLRYVYFTDIEAQDPALWNKDRTDCIRHYYAAPPTPARPGDCVEIQFTGGDVIRGPLHSNDALQINGPILFTDPKTETSWADGASPAPGVNHRWWGSGTPDATGYQPVYQPPILMPDSNGEIQRQADPAPPNNGPGCLYSGQTRIRFAGTKMYVLSPGTVTAPSRCYNTSTPAARATEQMLSIPSVLYIQTAASCLAGASIGYPIATENTTYDCKDGDAFVQGTATGQVTVATDHDIIVTGDLKTTTNDGTGTDVIGLVANNYVSVYHPVNGSDQNLLSAAQTVHEIDAAILSVAHSFLVQNWNKGAPLSSTGDPTTKLTVRGAIAQKYRGPVGTGSAAGISTGYLKNYIYDSRLLTLPPPFFLKPVSAPWGVTKLTE